MLWGNNWRADSRFTADRNCYWSEAGPPDFDGRTFREWQQTGRDANSIVADPGFVDAANGDFRLKPDSPALELGFQPIDLERVGLQGSAAWRNVPQGIRHRSVETAQPPEPVGPIREDREDYAPGEVPDGAVAAEGGARVVVSAPVPASGQQCMRFEDAEDATPWKPHWCVYFEPRADRLRVTCRIRNEREQPATIELELRDWPRDAGRAYQSGPLVRLLPDGTVKVPAGAGGWETAGTYPVGSWIGVEIELPQGADDHPGPWTLRLQGVDGQLVMRGDLPMRHAGFRDCNWFGIVGADTQPAAFCVDDIEIK
jgi:hypothetical protein